MLRTTVAASAATLALGLSLAPVAAANATTVLPCTSAKNGEAITTQAPRTCLGAANTQIDLQNVRYASKWGKRTVKATAKVNDPLVVWKRLPVRLTGVEKWEPGLRYYSIVKYKYQGSWHRFVGSYER